MSNEPSPESGSWEAATRRLRDRTELALEAVDTPAPEDRALFVTEVTADMVTANRVLQSLLAHIADVAEDGSTQWSREIISLLVPSEQATEHRVAVRTGAGDTAIVPMTTLDGGVAWQQRSLSLADLDRWRDRTLTRRGEQPGRSRGLGERAEQVFLPPTAIRTALNALDDVFVELERSMSLELAESNTEEE